MLERVLFVCRTAPLPEAGRVGVPAFAAAVPHVRGAWLHTGRHCAVLAEGTPDALDTLVGAAAADPRCEMLDVVQRRPVPASSFAAWQAGYDGPATYVDRHIRAFLSGDYGGLSRGEAAAELAELIHEFVLIRGMGGPGGAARE